MGIKAATSVTIVDVSDGEKGDQGNGIQTTIVTYLAGASGTVPPSGTWSSSPPSTSVSTPYIWTKTILVYDDGTQSAPSYSIGSTPDSIQVGGRNLLFNSKGDSTTDWFFKGSVVDDSRFGKCIQKIATGTSEVFLGTPRTAQVDKSAKYTFSCYIWVNSYVSSVDIYWLSDTESDKKTTSNGYVNVLQILRPKKFTPGQWNRVEITFTTNSDDYTGYIRVDNNGTTTSGSNASMYVTRLKLEKGTKATDWTPAPEDIDSSISDVKTTAEQTKEHFKWIVESGTSETDFTLTERTASLVANYINLNGSVTFSGLSSAAKSSIADSIQVGGRNLALKTGTKAALTGGNTTNQCINIYTLSKNWTEFAGKYITISFDYVYSDGATCTDSSVINSVIAIGMGASTWNRPANIPAPSVAMSGHVSKTFLVSSNVASHSVVQARIDYLSGTCTISNFKFEIGNKATDWTPAPEDVDSGISTAQTTANTAVSNAAAAQTTANTANSTANTAVSNAAAAQSTANTANSTANTANAKATYHYGTCGTEAATSAKTVTCSGFILYTGAMITVRFQYGNAATSPTLNVNGTGAKPIVFGGATSGLEVRAWNCAWATITFVYDGTYWRVTNDDASIKAYNAQTTANSAYSWTSTNGSNMTSLLSMVKKWTNNAVSDTTTINGGWISTNTITANKLAIGDFTNYCTVNPNYPDTMLPSSHQFGGTVINGTADTGSYVVRQVTESKQYFMLCDYTPMCFNVGDELYFYGNIPNFSSTDCSGNVCIWLYNSNKGYVASYNFWSGTFKAKTWNKVSGSIKFTSAGVSNVRYFLVGIDKGTSSHAIGACDYICRKKSSGALIVDGTITASKLNVTSLSAISANLGTVTAGSIDIGSGKFKVTSAGVLTATSGTIGRYTITATSLYTGTGANQAGIGGNQAFWAGSNTSDSAPFRVSYSGYLVSASGKIGGWTIGTDSLTSSYTKNDSNANSITLNPSAGTISIIADDIDVILQNTNSSVTVPLGATLTDECISTPKGKFGFVDSTIGSIGKLESGTVSCDNITPFNNASTYAINLSASNTTFGGYPVVFNVGTTYNGSMLCTKPFEAAAVTNGTPMVFSSNGYMRKGSSSSRRYKDHIRSMTREDIERLWNLIPVWFKYKDGYLDEEDDSVGKAVPGFYAETVKECFPDAVRYNAEGLVEDWNYRTLIPAMMMMILTNHEEIKSINSRSESMQYQIEQVFRRIAELNKKLTTTN